MAYKYLDKDFLPEESKNTVIDFWNFQSEKEFEAKCEKLEKDAIGVIKANANIKVLEEDDYSPLPMLCESYVSAKLLDKLINRGYEDKVGNLMADFWDTLKAIRETQKEEKISSEETVGKRPVAGIVVF